MKPKKSDISHARLWQENRRLRRRVAELEKKLGINQENEDSRADEHFNELTAAYLLYRNQNYFSYLFSQIKRTTLWTRTDRIIKYSRFYLFLSRTFKTFMTITLWLQTSAAFLIIATGAVTVIPIIAILSAIALITTWIYRRRSNRRLVREIGNREVTVFIVTNEKNFNEGTYFRKLVAHTSQDGERIVFVVSPYFWSLRGLGGRGIFACARRESDNVWLLRNYYYFFFKRTILSRLSDRTTYVY
ncbi:MAG: hypothetical protein GX303_03090 [Clostridiales bacterium]|nr:hypothetical protein [Clostridiales bacterium]